MAVGNITEAFVKQYSNNLYNNIEVLGNAFKGKVDERSQIGEMSFYETLDSIYASEASDEHLAPTVISDIVHGKRSCVRQDYDVALLIQKFEEVKALVDFKSPYVKRIAESLSRKRDIETLKGFYSDAMTGKNAAVAVTFDYTNQVIPVGTGSTGPTGMNVAKLRAVKALFWKNGYTNQDKMYIALAGTQIADLLATTEVTSVDFNTVRALVNGEVDQFMGIEIVQSEQVQYVLSAGTAALSAGTWVNDKPVDTDTTSTRANVAWIKRALIVGENPTLSVSVDKRADLRNSWQAYGMISVGAVRMEEDGVIMVPCLQA